MELRKALYEALNELMKKDKNVIVIGADLDKPNGVNALKKDFKDRAISVGIQEQNMVGMAAGLASSGFIPFVNTFTPFLTRRALDQIAVSVAYANNPVKLIGTDPGICAELNGGTHMSFDDVGTIRSVPEIEILEPADYIELKSMIKFIAYDKKPYYLRMSRKFSGVVHKSNYKFNISKLDVLKDGKDQLIVSSGVMLEPLLKICNSFEAGKDLDTKKPIKKMSIGLINLNTFKHFDESGLVKNLKKTRRVLCVDNHNIYGGINSIVSELIAKNNLDVDFKCLGIMNKIGQVGKLDFLKKEYGLDNESIIKEILKFKF